MSTAPAKPAFTRAPIALRIDTWRRGSSVVEHAAENRGVGSSTLPPGTMSLPNPNDSANATPNRFRLTHRTSGRPASRLPWFAPLLLLASLVFAACGSSEPATSPSPTASAAPTSQPAIRGTSDADALAFAEGFDAERALGTVKTLADESFMGRHVGTPGEMKGAQFLSDEFKNAGLRPGGDNDTYLQSFQIQVEEQSAPPVLELASANGDKRSLRLRDDFRPVYGGTAGAGDVQAPAFFAGTGQDLSAEQVSGKIVMIVPGRQRDVIRHARDAGAVALVYTTGQANLLKAEGRPPEANAMPVAELSQSGSAALLEGSGHTREELNDDLKADRELPAFALSWTVHLAVYLAPPARIDAHNVIGLVPGSENTDRTVIVGAHYEEIGPDPDGVVFPAANDNASGTSVLLELARLFHETGFQPRTNVVFIGWSGHEEGLLGSAFYLQHSNFPLSSTALYLNVDTVGQGAAPELDSFSSSDQARKIMDQTLQLLRSQPSPPAIKVSDSPEGVSDDASFAGAKVPSLSLLWGGIFEDGRIHTTMDTADTVDMSKLMVTGNVSALALFLAAR